MKTGPKPLSPKAFAARHADRLNYTLVKTIESRKFQVRCLSCELERTLSFINGSMGQKCSCTHKRKFYSIKRTAETHTAELHTLGQTEYTCLAVGKLSKDKNVYLHNCGYKFEMTKDCFVGSGEPCSECRILGYSNEKYVSVAKTRGLVPIEAYVTGRTRIKHRFLSCNHVGLVLPEFVTCRKEVVRCRKCHPSNVWFRGKVQGKRFKVRSRVEIAFLKLLTDKGYDVSDIEYEPASGRIQYFNPVKKRDAWYTPDFKVNDTYIEVKDLSSLGLRHYNWIDKDEALLENRAKCKAARKALSSYRVFVYHKNKFHEVHDFWKHSEQKRITAVTK